MEKHFVTYNQALALKDLGFDEDCLGRWLAITEWEKPTGEIKLQLGVKVEDYDKNQCLAPLKSQVFEWFREKYNLVFNFISYNIVKPAEYHWSITWNDEAKTSGVVKTYEEAESSCIDKLIELCHDK
jgi:hypothetical protein